MQTETKVCATPGCGAAVPAHRRRFCDPCVQHQDELTAGIIPNLGPTPPICPECGRQVKPTQPELVEFLKRDVPEEWDSLCQCVPFTRSMPYVDDLDDSGGEQR